jgi:hypothetical protein
MERLVFLLVARVVVLFLVVERLLLFLVARVVLVVLVRIRRQ